MYIKNSIIKKIHLQFVVGSENPRLPGSNVAFASVVGSGNKEVAAAELETEEVVHVPLVHQRPYCCPPHHWAAGENTKLLIIINFIEEHFTNKKTVRDIYILTLKRLALGPCTAPG